MKYINTIYINTNYINSSDIKVAINTTLYNIYNIQQRYLVYIHSTVFGILSYESF
jgi:hypothetical protein